MNAMGTGAPRQERALVYIVLVVLVSHMGESRELGERHESTSFHHSSAGTGRQQRRSSHRRRWTTRSTGAASARRAQTSTYRA